jgi:hypothetical protein
MLDPASLKESYAVASAGYSMLDNSSNGFFEYQASNVGNH